MARKRVTWVESLIIDPCNPIYVPFCTPGDGCCTTKFKMILMDQNTMQGLFSDRLSVVRVLGDLWVTPDVRFDVSTGGNENYGRVSALNAEMFFGIKRGEVTTQSASATSDIWDTTGTDVSEFQWMKTWHHRWSAYDNVNVEVSSNLDPIEFNLNLPVSKPDVHTYVTPGTPFCNELVTGSGLICIETEQEVECNSCPQTIGANTLFTTTAKVAAPRSWHVHLDVKKRIPMRENQELYLMFNGRNLLNGFAFDDFRWQVNGELRALVQTG